MRVALLSWDGRGAPDLPGAMLVRAPVFLRAIDAVRARRGFEAGAASMGYMAAAVRRTAPEVVHAFSLPDAVVAARSGLPAAFTFPWVPARETVASRRGRPALLGEALAGCRVVAPDEATAAGLERWLGVSAPVVRGSEALHALHRELASR